MTSLLRRRVPSLTKPENTRARRSPICFAVARQENERSRERLRSHHCFSSLGGDTLVSPGLACKAHQPLTRCRPHREGWESGPSCRWLSSLGLPYRTRTKDSLEAWVSETSSHSTSPLVSRAIQSGPPRSVPPLPVSLLRPTVSKWHGNGSGAAAPISGRTGGGKGGAGRGEGSGGCPRRGRP